MLVLNQITKTFSTQNAPVLHHLSVTFHPGDFCIVLGNNGSGKSTLLKTISGEYSLDGGSILMNQHPIQKTKTKVAHVVQNILQGTVPEMSVFENIALAYTRLHGPQLKPYTRYREDITHALASLDLASYLDTPLIYLSGGQKQWIATLMAMSIKPDILLLDEHTSALDPHMHTRVMTYVSEQLLNRQTITLMVTHDLKDALHYGNRLIVLKHGHIILDANHLKKQSLTYEQLETLYHRGHHEC